MKQPIYPISIEPLLDYFNKLIPLSEHDQELVKNKFHPRLYRKRQFVLQEGDVCTQLNFVVRGCLRMYKVDEKGNIHILQFASENNLPAARWINDLGSFHGLKPSTLNIDTLEDTVVFQISLDDLIFLYTEGTLFDRIFRVLVENSLVRLQERLLQNISSTAEERYESFLEQYPHMVNRLSQVQIAAYLGVTPEFLSRLRNLRSRAADPLKP
ncbi:Crp/Fnr family transcriptional regulator [Dyadobacter sp. CY312]|uniref:Crp/Fnr family transcriptional regulator n=1 Tax=Dyadobacter sp. CY312 TaxID=2907303 RepID=UPI001F47D3F2|nr:Crp/Fnr family transcriptional regulator [Dyadobacter sp. CY312]MCE7039588.1 Crp/Fnr family transcriptional regulator [Dyadobacter sp. CY312]